MNYADLFRVTLPETALDIAALLVLVVDLGFLRKAALQTRDHGGGAAGRDWMRRCGCRDAVPGRRRIDVSGQQRSPALELAAIRRSLRSAFSC